MRFLKIVGISGILFLSHRGEYAMSSESVHQISLSFNELTQALPRSMPMDIDAFSKKIGVKINEVERNNVFVTYRSGEIATTEGDVFSKIEIRGNHKTGSLLILYASDLHCIPLKKVLLALGLSKGNLYPPNGPEPGNSFSYEKKMDRWSYAVSVRNGNPGCIDSISMTEGNFRD